MRDAYVLGIDCKMEWRKSYHLPYVSNTVNGKIDKLGPGKLRVKVICDSLVKHGRADLQFRQTELDISLLVNAKDATVTDVQPRPAVGVTTRSQSSKHSLAGTSTGSVNASKNKGWDVGGGAAASQTTPLHLDVRHTRGGTAGHTLSLEASQAQESNQDWSRVRRVSIEAVCFIRYLYCGPPHRVPADG